jgi:hypothetical protein
MPKDAPPNGDAPDGDVLPAEEAGVGPRRRVSEMQAKLHRWAVADPGRRFDDLFNLVHDPATLIVAWDRVATNRGAKTAGSDGWTVTRIESEVGVSAFLDDLRRQIKSGEFRPQPVRERKIPKPGGSGKVRRLGQDFRCSVVVLGGSGVCVTGQDLGVAQWHTSVQRVRDPCSPLQRVPDSQDVAGTFWAEVKRVLGLRPALRAIPQAEPHTDVPGKRRSSR